MEMNFDPMTGQPVSGGSDPAAGQPAGGGYDPMTGQPVSGGFDPMTGQPVSGGYDPMTGQPVSGGFDPMTGQPLMGKPPKKGGGILKWILRIGVPIAVIAVVAVVLIKSGIFLGKSGKVMLAASNTIRDTSNLMEDLQFAEILDSDKYTVEVSGKIPEGSMELVYGSTSSAKMLSGVFGVSGIPDIEFNAMLDSEALRMSIPSVGDQVYSYYYREDNDGYLMENMDRETVEAMNSTLASLCSSDDQKERADKLKDAVLDEIKSLEFEKISSEKFEVDGKDRDCKGYMTYITPDNIINILDAYEAFFIDGFGEEIASEMSESFEDIRRECDQMEDIELSFYLYKNKLAAINIYYDREEMEIRFLGGDTRMQNMEIAANGDVVMEIKGSSKDGKEKTRVIVENTDILSIEYDYESGDFEIDSMGEMYCRGNIQSGKKEFSLELDEFSIASEDVNIEGSFAVKKGADKLEMSGDEFDIGKATMEDFEELQGNLAGLLGLSGALLY